MPTLMSWIVVAIAMMLGSFYTIVVQTMIEERRKAKYTEYLESKADAWASEQAWK